MFAGYLTSTSNLSGYRLMERLCSSEEHDEFRRFGLDGVGRPTNVKTVIRGLHRKVDQLESHFCSALTCIHIEGVQTVDEPMWPCGDGLGYVDARAATPL